MNHTALLRLSTLLLVGAVTAPEGAQHGPCSPPPWREPSITYLDQPTPEARAIMVWAVDRFRDAGLQLPDVQISFPVLCDRKAALYQIGHSSIEFCRINRRGALHELAHAWDDTSGAVDRDAFLELRGLTVWWGGTEAPSGEQGSEQLAQIIAWGLMGFDERRVPQLPANSVSELEEAFAMLTRAAWVGAGREIARCLPRLHNHAERNDDTPLVQSVFTASTSARCGRSTGPRRHRPKVSRWPQSPSSRWTTRSTAGSCRCRR